MAESTPSSAPLNAFEKWYSDYHNDACDNHGGIDCTNPKGIAEDAWEACTSLLASQAVAVVHCTTCNDEGAVGNILTAEPCPDCSTPLLATRTAPERIWLDLGVEEAEHANFAELGEVTWSPNNATGHGIAYVRADAQPADALDAELLDLVRATVAFKKERGSVLQVHIDNMTDLLEERDAMAAAQEGGNAPAGKDGAA